MSCANFNLDAEVKDKINRQMKATGMDFNSLINYLLEENHTCKSKLEDLNKALVSYKEREVEAFAIGDALADGIYIMNKYGIIIAVNNAFCKMLDLKEEEIIGQHVQYFVDKKMVSRPVGEVVLEQKKKVSILSTLNNKKLIVTGNPIFSEGGEVTQVLTVVRDATELIKLQEQLEYSHKMSEQYLNELNYFRSKEIEKSGIIGQSFGVSQIKELINQVAKVDVTVLITGETGVGKEVVAREIFKNSLRHGAPYIKVNCAAIPENLLESELFGYEKGAFTGASTKEKLGFFEIANTGTILLDEIGELPMNLQTKLLRVLQEREIIRVGGTKPIKLDVRVIAATNQKLEQQVQEGKFREDLYYRLNVIPIHIPPLRSRKEDITLLVNQFLEKYNEKYGKAKRIDILALKTLERYDWPGNVRELENLIERLIIVVNEPKISSNHILKMIDNEKMSTAYFDKDNLSLKKAVEMVERQLIENVLKKCGSTHKAARVLGVSQPTVVRKMKGLGIKMR